MTAYTPAQIAKKLHVSRTKVMAWLRRGELVAVNVGENGAVRYRITSDALEDFLASRRVKPAAKVQPRRRIVEKTKREWF